MIKEQLWVVEGLAIFLDERVKVKFVISAPDAVGALTQIADLPKEYVMTYQEGNKRKSTDKWVLDQLKTKPIHHNIYFIEGLEGFECKEAECING